MVRAGTVAVAAAAVAIRLAPAAGGAAAGAGAAWPKVVQVAGGAAVSVWRDGRVVERSRSGAVLADSYCGSYARYRRWVAFMSALRAAVRRGEQARVAAAVARPFLWNRGGRSRSIATRGELSHDYEAIFSPAVRRAIEVADPRVLFCKNVTMVMLGSGVVWGDEPGGRPAVITVNAP